jgi:ATPase subunit of ABC transporter with duplicated ATPase domains
MENAVADFDGTLILVSHDRYFVSLFAERIWALDNGNLTDFRGTLEEYRAIKKEEEVRIAYRSKEKKEKNTAYRGVRDPSKAIIKRIDDIER